MTSRATTTLRQVDPATVDDPFWATVIQEHPAATYVLLPPDPPPPPGQLERDEVRRRVRRAADAWRLLTPLTTHLGEPDAPTAAWRGTPGAQRFVIKRSWVGIGRDAGVDLLARIGVTVGLDGWVLLPRRYADRSVLEARDDAAAPTVEIDAVAGEGATFLTVATAATAVATPDAAPIAEEAASWLR